MNLLDERRLSESNFSIRDQIKRQQLNLLKLDQQLDRKKQVLQKRNPPPGKMLIKAKGKLVMRVKNEKALADELSQTKHRADSDGEEDIPHYKTKNAPNLIIQSQVQNTPAPRPTSYSQDKPVYAPAPPPPTPAPTYAPAPPTPTYAPASAPTYAPAPPAPTYAPAPMYYSAPPPPVHYESPVVINKPVKYVKQPVHYVQEYIEEPVYETVRERPYSRSHYVSDPDHVIYEERAPHLRHSMHSPRHKSPPRSSYAPHRVPVRRANHPRHHTDDPTPYMEPHTHYEDVARRRHNLQRKRRDTNEMVMPGGRYGVIKHDIRPQAKFKVMVSNLHPSVTLEDVEELFLAVDELDSVKMLYPGVAEVVFMDQESAAISVDRYHNRDLDGQPMQLSYTSFQSSSSRRYA